jgi:hypothetical protein
MINIFLDDIRSCPKGFVLARTRFECQRLLETNKVNILSLDHDLGEGHLGTGYDVAMFIVEQQEAYNRNIWPKEIYLHTDNPVGRENMYQLLNRYRPSDVKVYPYRYR